MNTDGNVKRILIVGGGTAGWLAAAYLRRRTACAIALVESADIGTIGVGEATLPAIVDLVRDMKLDEDEFMRRCHATYKLGIKFHNWVHDGHAYWHPFGICGGTIDGIDLFHFWRKRVHAGQDKGPYSSYSLQALLGDSGKAHRPIEGSPVVRNYAYHLDAGAFAELFREIATAEGVHHVVGNVSNVAHDERGHIQQITMADGSTASADLYIDCTGFHGLLIEQALGDPFVDWSHQLLCDRAVVLRLPPDEQMPAYTQATALTAGWVWQIPLSNRSGCGYVYSSSHLSDDTATRELLAYANQDDSQAADVRRLDMRVGHRQNFWKGNCLSLGLAGGFVEPLESTGIFLIQRALEVFVECFPNRAFSDLLLQTYNARMVAVYEEVRDFILLHYLAARRDELPFWRDSIHVRLPDSLTARIELYQETGIMADAGRDPAFPQSSFYHILAAGGRFPRRLFPPAHFPGFASVCDLMDRIKAKHASMADSLPTHRALMQWLHGPPAAPRG